MNEDTLPRIAKPAPHDESDRGSVDPAVFNWSRMDRRGASRETGHTMRLTKTRHCLNERLPITMKKFSTIVLAAAVAVCSIPAFAAGPQVDGTYDVDVNIDVQAVVSMWANDDNVSLVLDGYDGNNSAASASSLSRVNNVAADISASVAGTLPTPLAPGGGINFFIFTDALTLGQVATSFQADAYSDFPLVRLAWNQATLGTQKLAFDNAAIATSIATEGITYAAATPGELPLVADYDLTVTWSIAPAV